MHPKRLLKLADLLDADAKNDKGISFNMGEWGIVPNPEKPMSCGTQACAMGLAALSGAFKRQGLTYQLVDLIDGLTPRVQFLYHGSTIDGVEAGAKLFEISSADSFNLFMTYTSGQGAVGERAMAKRLREFVAEHSVVE